MLKRLTALLLTLTSSLLLAFDGSTPSTAQTPEADGLVIYFSPYEYTAFTEGFLEILIQFDKIKPFVDVQNELWRGFH